MQNIDEILFLDVEDLHPHPGNPRRDLGDLTELAASIKSRGVMQNLTVVPAEDGYTIIIGHRRAAAAKLAGLTRLPCIVADLTQREQMEIMLTENMQRADLTPLEQAQSMKQLVIDFGATPEDIAAKTGFSARTVKHRLEIAKLDVQKLKKAEDKQITIAALEDLEQFEDIAAREKVLEKYGTREYFAAKEQAMMEQKEDKILPRVLEVLEQEGIEPFPKSEESKRWEKYDFRKSMILSELEIKELEKEIESAKKVNAKDGKIYYEIFKAYSGGKTIKILWTKPKKEKEKAPEKSPEKKRREELISERIKALTEITARAYRRRREYIHDMMRNKVMTMFEADAMLKAFAAIAIRAATDYIRDPDFKRIADEFLIDHEKMSREEARGKMLEKLNGDNIQTKRRAALSALYACYNDGEDVGFWSKYGGVNGFPVHQSNAILNLMYDFLECFGYEMSEDEIGLQNGTHELFVDPDDQK